MNPNDIIQKIQILEDQKVSLNSDILMLEDEIKEINLSNQMEIVSLSDQVELEEIDLNNNNKESDNYIVNTHVPKIKTEDIEKELEKNFKL